MADVFSSCPLYFDYSRYDKKIGGPRVHCLFQKLRWKTAGVCRLLYVFQLQTQGLTTPNRCSKKTAPRIFFKNQQTFPDTFLLASRKKTEWGSPCSFLLYEQNCLLPSLTRLPISPNTTITNGPVHVHDQYKTVASNASAKAPSVEL